MTAIAADQLRLAAQFEAQAEALRERLSAVSDEDAELLEELRAVGSAAPAVAKAR